MRLICIYLLFFSSQIWAQEEREIREVMDRQVECWNSGDLECFMEGYWKSDKLVFIGSKGLTYGWDTTLDNYKKSYPDKAAMGTLTFEIKIIEPLSDEFWFVVGKWNLQRKEDNPNGHFSLIFRKLDNEWVIVSDHSS
ncbi:MAG: nuclear transport factor 2 family protein [Cyclobacteriaceae bacterium]